MKNHSSFISSITLTRIVTFCFALASGTGLANPFLAHELKQLPLVP